MTYELAKKLKDAGFPQGSWGNYYSSNQQIVPTPIKLNTNGSIYLPVSNSYIHDGLVPEGDDVIYNPTLSELIDVVAIAEKGFEYLIFLVKEKKWAAHAFGNISGYGSTPVEAVANLWLVLNK